MSIENGNEMDLEALNLAEERRRRKQTFWRWVVICGGAFILAVIITFFVWGGAAKDNVSTAPTLEETTPTIDRVDIPLVTVPAPTKPEVTEPETTEPTKKPVSTKPVVKPTEPEKPEETEPPTTKPSKWSYDKNLTAEENIFIYLTDYLGYSNAIACGIIANIAYETGWKFNPDAGNSKYCYGLIQWLGGRLKNLKSWCDKNGRDYHTIQGQLDFMDWELKNDDPYGTYDYLLKCDDSAKGAYKAGKYFCYWYERPNNNKAASKWRGNEAKKYYESLVLGED